MIRVTAEGRIGGPCVVCELAAIVTGRALAFVVKRRDPDLLAEAVELDVGQALDELEEVVDARLGVNVQPQLDQSWLSSTKEFG